MLSRINPRALAAAGAVAALALALAGCAPGGTTGSTNSTVASKSLTTEKITLNFQTATPGDVVAKAVATLFEQEHPNITVNVTGTGYEDFTAQLPLQLASGKSPDVVAIYNVANLAKNDLLLPLNDYSKLYDWKKTIPAGSLAQSSVESNGLTLGGDKQIAVPTASYAVGVYYNKKLAAQAGITAPPTTLEKFNADLGLAKGAGLLPIQFGDKQGHAAFTIQSIAQAIAGPVPTSDWVFGKKGQTFDTPANHTGVKTLLDWNSKGYFPPVTEVNGTDLGGAVSKFVAGQGVFFVDGNWDAATIGKGLGSDVGFFVFPGKYPVVAGGATRYAISAKSAHPNEAAALLDFFASSKASQAIFDSGTMPNDTSSLSAPSGTLNADLIAEFAKAAAAGGLVNAYADATPSMNNTFTQQTQELLAGQTGEAAFFKAIQDDWTAAHRS